MFGKRGTSAKAEWLREAEQAYEKVFGKRDRLGEGAVRRPMTFSEIEEQAVREGNQLARWLIEGQIASEAEASGCHAKEYHCPFCDKPAKRKREDLAAREIHTRPGAVSFDRYEHYCSRCRRSFFPAGPQAKPQS